MALRLLFLYVILGFSPVVHAQEEPIFLPLPMPKPTPDPEDRPVNVDDYTSEYTYAPICFGYGLRFPIRNYSTKLSASDPDATAGWQRIAPAHIVDLSWHLSKKIHLSMGVSFQIQQLDKTSYEKVIYPPDGSADSLLPLTLKVDKKARVFGNSLFLEYSFVPFFEDRVWLYARADAGYMRYSAHASVFYSDQDGKMQYAAETATASTVFSGSIGMGLRLQFEMVGLKLLVGYQFQRANNFITRNQFDSWDAGFAADQYNFNGYPDKSLFSVQKSGTEQVSSVNSQVYFQATAYFDLGWWRE